MTRTLVDMLAVLEGGKLTLLKRVIDDRNTIDGLSEEDAKICLQLLFACLGQRHLKGIRSRLDIFRDAADMTKE